MTYREYAEKLSTIKYLVKKNATGRPAKLAEKLQVSEKTARRMINCLRQQGINIKYCRIKQSYILN